MHKNDFAPYPPMGWNSYDYYDTTVTESEVKANADYMAAHLKSFGWQYIIIDIQWYAKDAGSMRDKFQYIPFSTHNMDAYSRLLPDPDRFPSSRNGMGFAPLADYIHRLGLKFGIHIMRGIPRIAAHLHGAIKGTDVTADMAADPSSICGWNPDMYGLKNTPAGQAYYDSLLELYSSWGVDFIKCDDICNTNLYPNAPYSGRYEIEMLAAAIRRCGRPITLSLSPGPALIEQAWHYETYANMWRITDDFWDCWDSLKHMFTRCELWQNHVKKGCYPDCDMLPLGMVGKGFGEERKTRFTKDEQRTMITLWCLFGSPLMLGAELTKLDDFTLSLLTNKRVLDLLDPKCYPHQVSKDDSHVVWTARNEEENTLYTALFNISDRETELSIPVTDLTLEEPEAALLDLWSGEDFSHPINTIHCILPPHSCRLYQVLPIR